MLIVSGYAEEQLRRIIAAFILRGAPSKRLLDEFNGPLGNFSSRVIAAHALGLISKEEYADLNVVRKIRNKFAHDHRASFSDQDIAQMCKGLNHSAKDYGEVVVGARGQFTSAAVSLILNLTNRPHYVSRKRLKRETWPY